MTHLMTGPQHLEKAAKLAAEASPGSNTAMANAMATLALTHATIAQTLVWAALVAGDAITEPELAAPWMPVVDPTGKVRAAMLAAKEEREAERASREAEQATREAERAAREAAAAGPYAGTWGTGDSAAWETTPQP